MKLKALLKSGKIVPSPVRISETFLSVTDCKIGVLTDTEEHVLCDCRNIESAALIAHYHNKFECVLRELRLLARGIPEEYDDLHTKNLIASAERVIEDAEEVEGI